MLLAPPTQYPPDPKDDTPTRVGDDRHTPPVDSSVLQITWPNKTTLAINLQANVAFRVYSLFEIILCGPSWWYLATGR